ncbi:MAG: nucleotidyl transferase AbiEii/AbiGii toxin family protein [Erysipelotrichaceae bacterium]|jgi:hypothetical protein|nr:nucleotidyl transferase AbiEii/AbiGii toxin family protein [Erysipelotrichaceae bacterium]
MRLDNDYDSFHTLIIATSNQFNITNKYVEKDYWQTLLLKQIFSKEKGYIFKGGTCLSKCYKLINRFSEDLDISYSVPYSSLGVNAKNSKFRGISSSIKEVGLNITNTEKLRRDRYFNQFHCGYKSILNDNNTAINEIIVELAAQTPSFPVTCKRIQSFIGEYLESINRYDLVEKYELQSFDVVVQDISRTFVDKTSAICDYYLRDKCDGHSRHLYDLYKILPLVSLNDGLKQLFEEVNEYRKQIKICITAKQGIKLYTVLEKLIEENSYKDDYADKTYLLLYEKVSYNECIIALKEILEFLKEYDI